MNGTAAPGWYPDPQPGATGVRYWDGSRWTDQVAAAAPTEPAPFTPWGWTPGESAPGPTPPPTGGTAPTFPWAPAPAASRPPLSGPAKGWLAAIAVLVVVVIAFSAFAAVRVDHSDDGHVTAPVAPTPTTARANGAGGPEGALAYQPRINAKGEPAFFGYDVPPEVNAPRSSLPPALFAVPSGPDVVTPASARTVTLALWDIRRSAIAHHEAFTLGRFETGSALAVDAGRGCGCGHDQFGPATITKIGVRHTHTFPATFFAETATTLSGGVWNAVLVFTRASAAQPWRLAFAGGGPPTAGTDWTFPFALDASGYLRDQPTLPASTLAPRLAAYWQQAKDTGVVPPLNHWQGGPTTAEWAQQLAANGQGRFNASHGALGFYRFDADPHAATYAVPLADGSTLACASIVEEETYVSTDRDPIVQPTDLSYWGNFIEPGSYEGINEVREYSPCFHFGGPTTNIEVKTALPPETVTLVGVGS